MKPTLLVLSLALMACQQMTQPPKLMIAAPALIHDSVQLPYKETLQRIDSGRIQLSKEWKKNHDAFDWNKVDSMLLDAVLNKITPYWIGTDWDFNGMSEIPGKGSIACGYFVSTVLRDAGVRLQRISLSQQASQQIVKTFGCTNTKKYSDVSLSDFVAKTRAQGKGIYIVGLDYHVGFLVDDGTTLWFIHSTYVNPGTVIKEEAIHSAVLNSTHYRITGKISGDQRFLSKWLSQELFVTIKR